MGFSCKNPQHISNINTTALCFKQTTMTCTSINKKLTKGIFRFLFCVVIAALIRIIVPSLLVGSLKSFTLTNPVAPLETNPAPCTLCDGASSSTTTEQRRRNLCLEHVNPPTIPQVRRIFSCQRMRTTLPFSVSNTALIDKSSS